AMTRRHRIGAIWLAASLTVAGALPAAAQTETPKPVIDSAPWKVGLKKDAVVRGRLKNGTPGADVTLERRQPGGTWNAIQRKGVGQELKVRFRVDDLGSSAKYRLVYADEVAGTRAVSAVREIRVMSKLSFKASPDDAYAGKRIRLRGSLFPKERGRRVVIQQFNDGRWRTIARPRVRDGRYSTTFRPQETDRRRILRAWFKGDATSLGEKRADSLRIYRRDLATWYGPGFYGNRTACGRTLGYSTLGVAHRTLPCGTKVAIMYRGRTVMVEVIDRGPYARSNWDLTRETAERLRFSGTDSIGVAH
ncbi:MAG TPA: septal ring lytic transglycosylase RlpA family protein, partial [Actinomycetota bacterium]|nr:septal ring lytic transglycosylase RlpA family protein [Actinomycetota bacterium]